MRRGPHTLNLTQESGNNLGLGWTSSEVTEFIQATFSRDIVLECLLGHAAEFFTKRMVLVVGRAAVQPHMVSDWPELEDRDIDELRTHRSEMPADAAVMAQETLTGMPSDMGLGQLFEDLEIEETDKFCAIPLPISRRTAVLLLGQLREGVDVIPLEAVSFECAEQLETLIKMTKSGSLPPKDQRVPAVPESVLARQSEPEPEPEPEPEQEPAPVDEAKYDAIVSALTDDDEPEPADESAENVSPAFDELDDQELDESSDAELEAEIEDALSQVSQVSEAVDGTELLSEGDVELVEDSEDEPSSPPGIPPLPDVEEPTSDAPSGLEAESSNPQTMISPPGFRADEKSPRETDEIDVSDISGSPRISMGAASSAAEDIGAPPQLNRIDEEDEPPAPPVASSSATMFGIPVNEDMFKDDPPPPEPQGNANATMFGLNFSDIQAAVQREDKPEEAPEPSEASEPSAPSEASEASEPSVASEPSAASEPSVASEASEASEADESDSTPDASDSAPVPSITSSGGDPDDSFAPFGDLKADSVVSSTADDRDEPVGFEEPSEAPPADFAAAPDSEPEPISEGAMSSVVVSDRPNEPADVDVQEPSIVEASEASHTLIGGIAAQAEIMSAAINSSDLKASSPAGSTMQGGIEAPDLSEKPEQESTGFIPGALILKPRRKKKRTKTFTEPPPQRENPNATMRGTGEPIAAPPKPPERQAGADSSNVEEVPVALSQEKSSNTMMGMQWKPEPEDERPSVDDAWLDYFSAAEDDAIPKSRQTMQMEPEPSEVEVVPPDSGVGEDSPRTLPPEALELILESGPIALDLEDAFNQLDDRDKKIAFGAVDEVVSGGEVVLSVLGSMFPGRLFIDRYQHTVDSMPDVSEHGPVLAALVRLGEAAADVVIKHLNDSSIESRFYATFLLTRLPAQEALPIVVERLFDKDAQIRDVAKGILKTYHLTTGFDAILEVLREEIELAQEDKRVESSADLLAHFRDRESIQTMIDQLGQHGDHTNKVLLNALLTITLQPLTSPYDWKQWWSDAKDQPRSTWIVAALNSNSEQVRMQAFDEIQRIPGLDLAYHPTQASKERERAQRLLEKWYEENQ